MPPDPPRGKGPPGLADWGVLGEGIVTAGVKVEM